MFKLFDVDRRIRTLPLILIALVAFLTTAAVPAEEAETLGQDLSIVFGGDFFQDPDEDAPDPDPLVAEVFPLVLTELMTVLFQMDGPGFVALHNAADHRLFVAGDGSEVTITLAAGSYELRVEGQGARGAVQLHLERVP